MGNILNICQHVAQALMDGHTVYEIAKATGKTKTEILNMADNANHRIYNHMEQYNMNYESTILNNAILFEANKRGQRWLKLREQAIKARPIGMDGHNVTEAIEEARKARKAFTMICSLTTEINSREIAENFAGYGREWNASGKRVKEFAEANGVSETTAAELVGNSMAVAQDYVQAVRGNQIDKYIGLIEEAIADYNEDDGMPSGLEELVIDAYARAAQWNQPAEGLLIRDFAQDMGFVELLPTWEDNLKKNMPSAEQAAASRQRTHQRATAKAQADQAAEAELTERFGTF